MGENLTITYHYFNKNIQLLSQIPNLKKYEVDFPIIALLINHHDKEILLSKNNNKIDIISSRLNKVYNIDLNDDDRSLLIYLIITFKYKLNFSIKFSISYYVCNSDIPKSILKGLDFILLKHNIELQVEDKYTLAIFIYQLVCRKYLNKTFKFLICDSSAFLWKSLGFKEELLKYLPKSKIEVTSSLVINNYNLNNFDYTIVIDSFNRNQFSKYNNIIFLEYKDYFNINSFWGHLLFGKGSNFLD